MDTNGADTLDERLQALKRRGCNLLVTGEVREDLSPRMTRKLLGVPEEPRTRVLALTDQDRADVPKLLPRTVESTDDDVRVVDYGCDTRSAVAAGSSESATRDWSRRDWARRDLDDFRTDLCDAITTTKDAESGFDPAELRVSVFTLSYLVSQHETAAVERFVGAVGDHVRGVSGMGHFHLPLADDSPTVRRLAPLFDARIELREKRGQPEQRWHFPDWDDSTGWVGV